MKTTSQLSEELNSFYENYDYTPQSADELRYELQIKRGEIRDKIEQLEFAKTALNTHIDYLSEFINDWDNAVENENNIRKGLE